MAKLKSRTKARKRRRRYQLSAKAPTPTYVVRLKLPKVEIRDKKWYVIRTMANMDRRVAHEAEAENAETYVPILVEERLRRNRRVEAETYPAAGYVFVAPQDGAGSVLALGRCNGAIDVLAGAEGPCEVKRADLQRFADVLTGCNEERREAYTMRSWSDLSRFL